MKTGTLALKLGVFFAVTGLALAYLGVLLGGGTGGGAEVQVAAVFTNVSFLKPGDEVRIAGVHVGRVDTIGMRPDSTVSVAMSVSGAPQLTDGTAAAIRYKNLSGDRYVELSDGPGTGRPLTANDTIPVSRTTPALDLDVLVGGFEPLFQALSPDQVNQLSGSLIQVLQGQAGALSAFLAAVSSATSALADRDQLIGSVIDNLDATLRTFDQHSAQVADLLVQARDLVSGLAADRNTITGALSHLNDLSGTAAALLPVLRPDLNADIRDLGQVSQTLDNHQGEVDAALRELPDAYRAVARIGVHGSFFNAYLCSVRVRMTGADGQPVYTPFIDSSAPRCQDGSGN
ncbi:MCE family protein [Amycolatopsis sp. K13G38]|uniref:MCE family protein n=1 Tax=Amycolatopsis acididurans TaxID=2724524 RepID=A0ABX1IWT6_9PSEU|nr:MlaD family protein [Amycolatopsis acididurans]NKQ51671.1 MCE family protein [Amycolatopsis acididurans]